MRDKVIVVGLDGMEPSIVEAMLERGDLPNLRRLKLSGGYTRLRTTYPAQTPVAWSSFATGVNPGGHGIFDFVRRNQVTYQPDFALHHFEKPRNPFSRPKAVSDRRGTPLWTVLTAAGIPSVVLRCPGTFPPGPLNGRMLAGVGVPDLRGSQGKGVFYTQGPAVAAHADGQVEHIGSDTPVRTSVFGPRLSQGKFSTCELTVTIDRAARTAVLDYGAAKIVASERAWSPWQRVRFRLSSLQSATGLVRFYLVRTEPCLEFYASPVNFDPEAPLFPISSPPEYAAALAREVGLFSTLGMAEDHVGLNNGYFNEDAYTTQCGDVFAERERMTLHELDRFTEGLLFVVFDTPDRINHMFWRYRDPRHPASSAPGARELANRIEDCYRRCDTLLERVLEAVDDHTLLIVLSDHGCSDFRRAFHINAWLREQRLLAVEPDAGLSAVNWSKTDAYALGFGSVYLNLKGREGQGIVSPGAEADRISRAIRDGLAGLRDPQTGDIAIHSVLCREDLYTGAFTTDAPDLIINFAPGYRASWQTALGETPAVLFEDNLRPWSGDHLIDPACVPGVLFMNRPIRRTAPAITDLAPTILGHLGVPTPNTFEGASLLE